MRSFGIRREVLFLLCLTVLPAVLLAWVLVVDTVERVLLEQKEAQVTDYARTAAKLAGKIAVPDGELRSAEPLLQDRIAPLLGHWDGLVGWRLVSVEGLRVAGSGLVELIHEAGTAGNEPVSRKSYLSWRALPATDGPSVFHIAVPVTSGPYRGGWLQLDFSLDSVRSMVIGLSGVVLLVAVLYGVAGIAVISLLLERRIVRPLRTLERAFATFVPEQQSSVPVAVDGPRELVRLANRYNAMMAALAESRERMEQARAAMARSERMASVGHLAAGMAHEIGNPLGAISGYLELLAAELHDRRELTEVVGFARGEVERIDRLLRDLLEFARPERGEQSCDAVAVVRQSLELLEHQGAFRKIAVRTELPDGGVTVGCSSSRLQQVLVNLLLNARDACGDAGEIRIHLGKMDGLAHIEVQDTGKGIAAENLDRVFDPFFTTKQPGQGWGLGLSICHRIVEDCGGRISIDSEPGQGSVFTVLLPLQTGEVG